MDMDETPQEALDLEQMTAEGLQELELERLEEVFSGAPAPAVEEVSGKYRTLVLAGAAHAYIPSPLKKAWALFASSPLMPWKGMEFEAGETGGELTGKNIVAGAGVPIRLFPFIGRIEPSAHDGADCLALGYEVGKNPPGIKQLRDELRKINPFLYLGRSTIRLRGDDSFLLYFCMEPE